MTQALSWAWGGGADVGEGNHFFLRGWVGPWAGVSKPGKSGPCRRTVSFLFDSFPNFVFHFILLSLVHNSYTFVLHVFHIAITIICIFPDCNLARFTVLAHSCFSRGLLRVFHNDVLAC